MELGQGYVMTMMLGLLMILAIGFWIFSLYKKNPEMTLGEILNKIFLRQKISVFVLTLIFINIAEAIWAASITPVGEIQINPLARIMTHGSVSLVAITCGIYLPSAIRTMLMVKGKEFAQMFVVFIGVFIGAMGLPYLNALLISGGLKETHHLAKILNGNFTVGFMHMSYAMQATVVALIAHYFFVMLDGIMILVSGDEGTLSAVNQGIFSKANKSKASDIDKKITERGEKATASTALESLVGEGIPFLLTRYKFNTDGELSNKISQANKVIDGMPDKAKIALAQRVAKLVNDIKSFDKYKKDKNLPLEERKEKNKEFRRNIADLFRASTKGGHGLGMTLPAKN